MRSFFMRTTKTNPSDCADAQADLSFRCAHKSEGTVFYIEIHMVGCFVRYPAHYQFLRGSFTKKKKKKKSLFFFHNIVLHRIELSNVHHQIDR